MKDIVPTQKKIDFSHFIVIGTGGQSRVVSSIIEANNNRLLGFIELRELISDTHIFKKPILGNLTSLKTYLNQNIHLALAIGNNYERFLITEKIKKEFSSLQISSAIHPQTFIEKNTYLAKHLTICIGSIICVEAHIAEGSIINSGAIVEHECEIGKYCHISPGARLAGRVKVGDYSHIGIGATIREKTIIGKNVTVGAGAVVVNDLPDNAVAVGIPAKIIKFHSDIESHPLNDAYPL